MLSKLFGSKCRVKILKIFLLNPDKKYYTRQLARELKLQVNAVRRELENLTKIGLIEPVRIDDKIDNKSKVAKKYYQALSTNLLFDDLKSLFSKTQLLSCQDFIDELQKMYTPKFLMLSGFFVGDNKAKTDLLLVGNFNKNKLMELISNLEKELNNEVNYTIMNQAEFIYRRQIVDRFLNDLLRRKNIIITGHDLLNDELIGEENSNIPVK